MPNQVKARVQSNRRVGEYHHLVLAGEKIADGVKPGHFVSIAVGGENSQMVTRRAFSIHRATQMTAHGSTLEIVVHPHGTGTDWLAAQQPGAFVDVLSPLGKPFALPKNPVSCLLVAGGYGSAPMTFLAEELSARGCAVDMVFGAGTESKLFDVLAAKRISRYFEVTTDDGSAGVKGRVSDVIPNMFLQGNTAVVYACGPMPMLQSVASLAKGRNIVSQVAVEESMACGIGVCMTCVLPIVGDDGKTRMTRSCVEGPVFRGDRVRWESLGTVPADCLGAPIVGGH